jgi:hypothetical protein
MALRAASTLTAALVLAACGGGGDASGGAPIGGPGGGTGPYQLTLEGDVTFQAHAGRTLRAALHLKSDNTKLDVQETTIAAAAPAFSVTFAPTLDPSTAYHLHYWIDEDGDGVCDPPDVDYQWAVDPPMGMATFVESERDPEVSDVCGSFPPP